MVALASRPSWTVAQYFEMERTNEVRHEYIDGAVYALAGGTRAHGVLAANLISLLVVAVRGGPCRVYSSDMKVRVAPTRYVYPDLSVSCDPVDRGDDAAEWLGAPRLVAEVLSPSTVAYDRGDKFGFYRQVASLREYVLVETTRRLVEVRSRGEDGLWTTRQYAPGEVAELPGLGVRLAVDEIYATVDLDEVE
jgi:Uma2 family endonuclease